jgi:hypothetical protein
VTNLVSKDGGLTHRVLNGAQEKVEGLLTKAEFMSSPLTGTELEVSHPLPNSPQLLRPLSRRKWALSWPVCAPSLL